VRPRASGLVGSTFHSDPPDRTPPSTPRTRERPQSTRGSHKRLGSAVQDGTQPTVVERVSGIGKRCPARVPVLCLRAPPVFRLVEHYQNRPLAADGCVFNGLPLAVTCLRLVFTDVF
jgi:hypothetical protein